MATEQSIDVKLTENKHRLEAAGLTPEQAELFLKLGLTPEQINWVFIGVQTGFTLNGHVWELNPIAESPVSVTIGDAAFVPVIIETDTSSEPIKTPEDLYLTTEEFAVREGLVHVGNLSSGHQGNFMCLVFKKVGSQEQ